MMASSCRLQTKPASDPSCVPRCTWSTTQVTSAKRFLRGERHRVFTSTEIRAPASFVALKPTAMSPPLKPKSSL